MPLANGEVFAGYRILRLLGTGGMGEVYLAQHPRLPRRDALKILPVELSANREFRDRFNREADLVATLYHPHIIGLHDRGETDGQLWISMDFIDGPDAGRLMRERFPGGLPRAQVVEIVTAVSDALDYEHRQGLLHRDIKPANILLRRIPGGSANLAGGLRDRAQRQRDQRADRDEHRARHGHLCRARTAHRSAAGRPRRPVRAGRDGV